MNKNYTKEFKEILSLLSSSSISSPNAIDIIIYIFQRYYSQENVEDLALVNFIKDYLINPPRLSELIDKLIEFQSEYQKTPLSRVDIGKVLPKAETYSKKYSSGITGVSHFILAALEEIPGLQELMKSCGGGGKDELIKGLEDNLELYKHLAKTVTDLMKETLFPSLPPLPINLPKNSDKDDDDMWESSESFMESIGFPLPGGELSKKKSKTSGETPLLDKYSKELTKETLDPVYGRESELSQLLEILGCKKKNNAILIGEPGVGKTSIVELLAQRIQEKKVPKQFLGRRIFSLDLNSLVAGTKYRGQYEERLQGIIEEVVSNPDIIIFIDEIHNLIGNGGSEGGNGDAANILKPYLAKGKFQCIGSTTFKEYRKYIEKDGALKRRFQNIIVEEPTLKETEIILKEIRKFYESYHNVTYPKEVIEACVKMSYRYLTDRYFPDKAIDLLDLSGSLARLSNSSKDTEIYLKSEAEVDNWQTKKINAVNKIDFESAIEYRNKERAAKEKMDSSSNTVKVTLSDVYLAVGKRSGVPLDSIGSSDLDKLRELNKLLPTKVIGQDKAIKEIIMSLQKNSLGIRDPQKPISSLLFVGPTGSGKTYLCKMLAKEFFGSEDALIKYDMSEYGERHEVTKLIGASASYVGYEDEPGFERVRKHPYSVVLFDEIEKAAKEVYQIFLSILDEGYITLANGTKVNFKNTIIIFTGNIGTKELSLFGRGLGYGLDNDGIPDKDKKDSIIKKSIEKTFAPEFINRLSNIVIFDNLGKKELTKIIDLEVSKLSTRLKESKITIKVSKSLKEHIISGCDPKYGARDLQRGISKNIEEVICEKLLDSDLPEGPKTFNLSYESDKVVIELKTKKTKDGDKLLPEEETKGSGEERHS